MRHNEVRFRSKSEREREVRLEDNYRQIGNPGLLTAARYCAAKRDQKQRIEIKPQFLMAAE